MMIRNSRNSLQYCRIFSCTLFKLIVIGSILSSCTQPEITRRTNNTTDKGLPFTKTEIKYAQGFDIEYFDTYKIASILTRQTGKTDTLKYVLVQRGSSAPKGYSKSQIITIPVNTMIGMTSAQIALADFIESPDIVVGLGSMKYVNSAKIRANIKAGKIKETGEEGSLNKEAIISIHPDVLIGSSAPVADFSHYQTLLDAGIPVLLNREWLESNPLGRAEWVKLMAALVNKEALVNKKFAAVENEYKRLSALGRKAAYKPQIIVGMPFKGSWFVPDGTSFMATFFKDAGASYKWDKVKGTGSMGLSFESVAPAALKADFWINCGTATSKQDIAAMDTRYTDFKPFKNNTIYNFNKKINNIGSNDYWESGVVNPQIVLADLIKILHPELLPKHELVYYKHIL